MWQYSDSHRISVPSVLPLAHVGPNTPAKALKLCSATRQPLSSLGRCYKASKATEGLVLTLA
jgi:hypothetical protein